MFKQKKTNNKKHINKLMNDELTRYNEQKESNLSDLKNSFENYHYLSNKEREEIEKKFSKPKNISQQKYVSELNKSTNKIVLCIGPAGSGKSLFCTEIGIRNFLLGKYEKLIFTRPAVGADEDLGYLPGTLEDKMAPYIRPIYDIIHRFISPNELNFLISEKIIEIAPLSYMRGRTFKNSWIIADEMQNCSINQMKMLLTRIGHGSRMCINGDLEQNDRKGEVNGLQDFMDKFRFVRSDSISSVEFDNDDIEREQVVKEVLKIYSGKTIPEEYTEE